MSATIPPTLLVLDEDDDEEADDDDEAAEVCFLYLCRGGPNLDAVGLFKDLIRAPLYPILSAGGASQPMPIHYSLLPRGTRRCSMIAFKKSSPRVVQGQFILPSLTTDCRCQRIDSQMAKSGCGRRSSLSCVA